NADVTLFVERHGRPAHLVELVPLRGGVFSYRAGPIRGAFAETLIDRRNRARQSFGEEFPNAGRGADGEDAAVGRRIRHTACGTSAGVPSLPDWRLRVIGAEYL